MGYEILYTSAPSGLRPGSSGYCTVQSTRGIPAPALEQLESLSGYRHLVPFGTASAHLNPVNFGHYLVRISGRREHVVSRVSDYELDYTGRSNKLAHHVVIDDPQGIPNGPAWLMSRGGWMRDRWDGEVGQISPGRVPPADPPRIGPCRQWAAATGDAGWAGVLAESFLADPNRKVFLIYHPGTDVLALFDEALSLLPAARRWDVTFCTYGAALPATVDCVWSGIPAGSPEVDQSRRFIQALRIDLTASMPPAQGDALVAAARTGKLPPEPAAPKPPPKPSLPAKATRGSAQTADDEESLDDELAAESARPVATAAVQRQPGLPPALPGARAYEGDGSNPLARYIAGAIVATGVIGACVILALCWPKRPDPTPVTVASNNGNSLPDAHKQVDPAQRVGPADPPVVYPPAQHGETPVKPHVPPVDPPIQPQPQPQPPAPVSPPPPPPSSPPPPKQEDKPKGTIVVSYVKRTAVPTTTFSFVSPFDFDVEISRARLFVPVDHADQPPRAFSNLVLGSISDNPENSSERRLISLFKKGESQPHSSPQVQFSIPRKIRRAETFDIELTGLKIDAMPAVCFCGCMLESTNADKALLVFQKTRVRAMGPTSLQNERFTIQPGDNELQSDLGRLRSENFLSFKELDLVEPPDKQIELTQIDDEDGFQATLYQLPETDTEGGGKKKLRQKGSRSGQDTSITLRMTPEGIQNGCPELKVALIVGKTRPAKSTVEARIKDLYTAWKQHFKLSPLKIVQPDGTARFFAQFAQKDLEQLTVTAIENIDLKDIADKEAAKLDKLKAKAWIEQLAELKRLLGIIEGIKHSTESPLVLKSGRITCRLQDLENTGSQAPTSEIDLILIGDAQPNTDIDYHH